MAFYCSLSICVLLLVTCWYLCGTGAENTDGVNSINNNICYHSLILLYWIVCTEDEAFSEQIQVHVDGAIHLLDDWSPDQYLLRAIQIWKCYSACYICVSSVTSIHRFIIVIVNIFFVSVSRMCVLCFPWLLCFSPSSPHMFFRQGWLGSWWPNTGCPSSSLWATSASP